jgi:hypothetical protein
MATIRQLSFSIGQDGFNIDDMANMVDSQSNNANVTTTYRSFRDLEALNVYIQRHIPTIISVTNVNQLITIPKSLEWIISKEIIPEKFISAHPSIKMACVNGASYRGLSALLHMGESVKRSIKLAVYAQQLKDKPIVLKSPKIDFYNLETPKVDEKPKQEETKLSPVLPTGLSQKTFITREAKYTWTSADADNKIHIHNNKSESVTIKYNGDFIHVTGCTYRHIPFIIADIIQVCIRNGVYDYGCPITSPGTLQIE